MSSQLIVLASHKGGTGCSTLALALSWTLGQLGYQVALCDASEIPVHRLVACKNQQQCEWQNVRVFDIEDLDQVRKEVPIVIVDAPPLTDPKTEMILTSSDSLLLTCLADPLSLRTLETSIQVGLRAQELNPKLQFLGIQFSLFDSNNPIQVKLLQGITARTPQLIFGPAVPLNEELGNWPMHPGLGLEDNPTKEIFQTVCQKLISALQLELELDKNTEKLLDQVTQIAFQPTVMGLNNPNSSNNDQAQSKDSAAKSAERATTEKLERAATEKLQMQENSHVERAATEKVRRIESSFPIPVTKQDNLENPSLRDRASSTTRAMVRRLLDYLGEDE